MSIFVASFHQLWVIGQLLTWIHIQRPWQQGWLENPCQKSRCVPRDFPAMVDCREGSHGSHPVSHVFSHPPGVFPANIPPKKPSQWLMKPPYFLGKKNAPIVDEQSISHTPSLFDTFRSHISNTTSSACPFPTNSTTYVASPTTTNPIRCSISCPFFGDLPGLMCSPPKK